MARLPYFLLLSGLLFVAGWLAFPVQKIVVVGAKVLPAETVARLAGLYSGAPWLYLGRRVEKRLREHPWIASAKLRRPRLGVVVIEIEERRPVAYLDGVLGLPSGARNRLVLDESGQPLPNLRQGGVRIEGFGPGLEEALDLARNLPSARVIRYSPAGYGVDFGRSALWAPTARELLRAPRPKTGRLQVYAWGVSVRQ